MIPDRIYEGCSKLQANYNYSRQAPCLYLVTALITGEYFLC